ncbi:MAG TPA: hypothetical protein VF950_24645 [Planctomycetota bacterium]
MDGDWGKKNRDLYQEYQVTGYPTVILTDPEGKSPQRMSARDPEGVVAHLRRVTGNAAAGAGEAVPLPPFPDLSAQAFEEARKSSKPLAVYFHDDSPGSSSTNHAFADAVLKGILPRFVFVKSPLSRGSGDSAKYDVTRAPTILVLNPLLEKPEERPLARITGSRSAREIRRDLEAALQPGAAAGPATSGSSTPPPPPPPPPVDETLSDDEVDRQFIQASMVPAREWLRKGNKPKAIAILEDIIKTYPKHAATAEVRKLLEDVRK